MEPRPLSLWLTQTDAYLVPFVIFLFIWVITWGLSTRIALLRKPLPPGPSILTRFLDRNSDNYLAIKLRRWDQQYGSAGIISMMDFVHFGKPTIVLSSPKTAMDLLDKRGNVYSSRPRNVFAVELTYKNSKGSLLQMGTKLRRFRTLISATMNVDSSKKFRGLEEMETKLMLRGLLQESNAENYRTHAQRSIHSVAFCTSYGQRLGQLTAEHRDFYSSLERYFISHMLPGTRLVDHFPILLRLPRALQWFRKEAEDQADKEERFFRFCADQTKAVLKSGHSLLGFCTQTLERQYKYNFSDSEVTLLSNSPYLAGVTTTFGTFEAFVLAAILYPDMVRKAQKEIDSVVGPDRMPDFQDFESLSYIRATIKECLRWHPFTPLGLPHATTEDDFYEGMFIPAGSTVIANIYAITRNEELFPSPEEFRPERFIGATDPLLKNYNMTFGFGRRLCPGQHVATDQLFIIISRILWAFDIMTLEHISDPVATHAKQGRFGPPTSLPHKLVPRSDHARSIILEQALEAEKEAEAWETFQYKY